MKTIMRTICDWTDDKYNDVLFEEDGPKRTAKLFGIGVLEGALDGALIVGAACVISSYGKIIKRVFTKK